jgi:hypothetical protein
MPGYAHVLQVFYDLHRQTITIKPPVEQFVMIFGARKTADMMLKQLKDPKVGLENIGGKFGQFTSQMGRGWGKPGKGAICATCSLTRGTKLVSSRNAARGSVTQIFVRIVGA